MCSIVFEKAKVHGGTVNETLFMQNQPSKGLLKKDVMRNFAEFTRKHQCQDVFFDKFKLCRSATSLKTSLGHVFFVNFTKYLRTPFLQSTTGQLLLIIAVSTVVKGELVNETVSYDIKTRAYVS